MSFQFITLDIPGPILIKPEMFRDNRGFFMETYKYSEFTSAGISERFIQDNHSGSTRHVLRGLHYQKPPMQQGKLLRCVRGSIFDVCVDIRKGSPTFGRWQSVELSETNGRMLYIPPFFAHGFVVLSDAAETVYKCTSEYSAEHERGILWNDPDIGIAWPIQSPILSEKDTRNPLLCDADL